MAGATYLTISAYVADKFSAPVRVPVTQLPSQYGLPSRPVSFYSTVDHIRLEGWDIGSPGSKVIDMLHGWNGNRGNGDTALPITQDLVAHDHDKYLQ